MLLPGRDAAALSWRAPGARRETARRFDEAPPRMVVVVVVVPPLPAAATMG